MVLARGISVGARGESRTLALPACRRQAREDRDLSGEASLGGHLRGWGKGRRRTLGELSARSRPYRGGMATVGCGRMADPVAEMEIRRGDYDDMRLEGGVGARGLGCCGGGERMAESRRCELTGLETVPL